MKDILQLFATGARSVPTTVCGGVALGALVATSVPHFPGEWAGFAQTVSGAALGLGLVLAQTAKPPEPVVAPPKRGRPVKEKVVPIQPAS